MRSEIISILIVLHVAGSILAASPQLVFADNKDLILSGQCHVARGFCFGVGTSFVRTGQTASDNLARELAVLNAKSRLICSKAVEGLVWPTTLDAKTVSLLTELVVCLIDVHSTVRGVVVVHVEKATTGCYTAVIAVPEDNLASVRKVSLDEVARLILEPHWLRANFRKHPKELYSFYLTQREIPPQLSQTRYSSWNDAQLDLFCGIQRPSVDAKSVPNNAKTGEISSKRGMPSAELIANENETIGF